MVQSPVYDWIIAEGMAKSQSEVFTRGKREGEQHKARETARSMKRKRYPIADISEITGLSVEEVEQL